MAYAASAPFGSVIRRGGWLDGGGVRVFGGAPRRRFFVVERVADPPLAARARGRA